MSGVFPRRCNDLHNRISGAAEVGGGVWEREKDSRPTSNNAGKKKT